jgi:hypothetical protein
LNKAGGCFAPPIFPGFLGNAFGFLERSESAFFARHFGGKMDILKKSFVKLSELEQIGMPAGRTLENRMRQGVVVLGDDVPPLKTMRIGGSRVVARAELVRWLQATGGIMADESGGDPPDQPSGETMGAPRRGRPRKHVAAGGAK